MESEILNEDHQRLGEARMLDLLTRWILTGINVKAFIYAQ